MRDLVKRRANAEPVAYLVGHREFFSLDFQVGPGVFIPRPDTELLVMAALDAAREIESPEILELCTGSGCVSIAIAKNNPQARLTAVERESIPFDYATRNIEKHGLGKRITLLQGSLFEPVPQDSRFHVIVSNPPYILSSEIPTLQPDVRNHEPHAALDGGADGLDVIRELIGRSPEHLVPGGWLMFELDPANAQAAASLMRERGYDAVDIRHDLSGQGRVVVGCWGDKGQRTP